MRRGIAALAGTVAVALGIAVTVPVSAASWVDTEWVQSPVATLECGNADTVDASAWGRMLAGTLRGQSLDPVTAVAGLTVANLDPATSSTATPSSGATALAGDAWTSSLTLSALGGIDVGAGVTLPFGTSTGVVTQYGRATSAGLSVGASGAVTTGGGVAALESPGATTPRLATLQLSTLLDASLPLLSPALTTAQLADVRVRMGSLGAIAAYDSCDPLWSGAAPGSALVRQYLVDDLALDLTSSRVTDLAAAIRTSLTSLEATIDGLDYATTTIPAALTAALNSALNLGVVSLGQVDSLAVAIDVDLAPVRALVAGSLSDGVVAIDLSTGRVSMDLEALFGAAYASSTGLNGQPANTSVLTPAMLSAVSTRVGALLNTFVTTTLTNAVATAINNAAVTVAIAAKLNVVVTVLGSPTSVLNALQLSTTISGTVGGFAGAAGHATPTASTTVTVVPGLGAVSALVSALLGSTLGTIVGAVSTNARAIGATVVTPLAAQATSAAAATLTALTATTIPAFLGQLGGVLSALDALVNLTVNARPDAAGSVGAPASPAAGRYFQTALHVGVVNSSSASVASLFLANASVGPNALRP